MPRGKATASPALPPSAKSKATSLPVLPPPPLLALPQPPGGRNDSSGSSHLGPLGLGSPESRQARGAPPIQHTAPATAAPPQAAGTASPAAVPKVNRRVSSKRAPDTLAIVPYVKPEPHVRPDPDEVVVIVPKVLLEAPRWVSTATIASPLAVAALLIESRHWSPEERCLNILRLAQRQNALWKAFLKAEKQEKDEREKAAQREAKKAQAKNHSREYQMGELARKRRRHALDVQQWIRRENEAFEEEDARDPTARSSLDPAPAASTSPAAEEMRAETEIDDDAEGRGDEDTEAEDDGRKGEGSQADEDA